MNVVFFAGFETKLTLEQKRKKMNIQQSRDMFSKH